MHVTTARSHLISGIAVLGVGAIALAPIQPLPDQASPAQEHAVSNLAVTLASTIDPITPWVDTLQAAAQNIAALANFYAENPLPLAQTVWANLGTYLDEAMSGNAGLISEQISTNVTTFFEAPWWNKQGSPIVNDDLASEYISNTNIGTLFGAVPTPQSVLYASLGLFLPEEQLTQLVPILQFVATPFSGQLAGLLSPAIGSVVALTRSFTAVSQFFQDGDLVGAINELINIPASVTNAVLNGAGFFDLTSLASGLLPDGFVLKRAGLNLGGLISPPVPYDGSLVKPEKPVTQFTGGTFFDNVSLNAVSVDDKGKESPVVDTPGLPASFAGSVVGLGQFLGENMLVTPPPPTTAAVIAPQAAATVDVEALAAAEADAPVAASGRSAPADHSATADDSDGGHSAGKRSARTGGRG